MKKRGPSAEFTQQQQPRAKQQKMSFDQGTLYNQLHVSDEEWDEAIHYFSHLPRNSSNCKLAKKHYAKPLLHSFVKLDSGEIVALANRKQEGILGQGTSGVVVTGQFQSGENCAIKVEAGKRRNPQRDTNVKIMKKISYHLGESDRRLPEPKEFKGQLTQFKRYTAFALRPGKELTAEIENLSYVQKLIVGIRCCEALAFLHSRRIIHVDIKPGNFIAKIEGNKIIVNSCDYDYSMILPEGQTYVQSDMWAGTPEYLPPEISPELEISTYQFASDVFSLGIMFRKDLKLPAKLCNPMLIKDPERRCPLEKTILRLKAELAKQPSHELKGLSLDSFVENEPHNSCRIL